MPRIRLLIALAGAVAVLPVLPAKAELAGAYLAARSADMASDFRAARDYLTRALAADPANTLLMEGLVAAQIGMGDAAGAVPVARRLSSLGAGSQLAAMVLISDTLRKEDYAAALADFQSGNPVVGPLVDQLLGAWTHLGAGSMAQALEGFEAVAEKPGLAAFGNYHKAMALALVGDFEGADALFAEPDSGLMALRRALFAHVQVLSQLDRPADALARLEEFFGSASDPEIEPLRRVLEAQVAASDAPKLPFDTVRNARDGAAEVFYVLAAVLQGEAPPQQTLTNVRMTEFLRPDHVDAAVLSAAVLQALGQEELAIAAFERIGPDSPAWLAARSGRVQALYRMGRKEEAITAMQALAAEVPDASSVHIALADLLRRESRYKEAAEAYGRALDLIPEPEPQDWVLFYSRGIAWEQAKEWGKAEPDFRKALELLPDQPEVLNYLGYSMLDRNERIPEALAMIERAVELYPESGHIIDSLAWGYFLTGRYEEAQVQMERASTILPVDPVVTDHLGDVYWAVGRVNEARFQWRRALSFDPSERDARLIRRKLEVGLDAVLTEEGLPALSERGMP